MENLRTVVVMGGTTGIGREISQHLAAHGHPVAALGPVGPDGPAGPQPQGPGRYVVPVDLDDVTGFPAAMDAAHRLLGRVDVLVNALDRYEPVRFEDLTPAALASALDHNLKAVFFAGQAAVPFLKDDGGIIVNLSSARGSLAATDQVAYAAAKAGVAAMTRDLATDLGRYGIKVNSLMLAPEDARGLMSQDTPGPADVCEAVSFLIGHGAYLALDAFDYPLDGGLSVLLDRVEEAAPAPVAEDGASKVAIITGASSGLGAEAARIFARRGLRIAILDVLDAEGEAVAEEIRSFGDGADAAYFRCDISDTADVQRAVQGVVDRLGRIDILLNSAAITNRKRTPEITEADWDRFMAIDLWGPFVTTMACAPHLRAVGGGRVINFSSMLSTLSHGRHTLYGGAKEAMNSMTRAMGAGLKQDNIQVFSVLPAYVITPMISFRLQDKEWIDRNYRQSLSTVLLYPEHVTDVFHFLATSQTDGSTGHKIYVDTGYLNFRYKLVPWPDPDEGVAAGAGPIDAAEEGARADV